MSENIIIAATTLAIIIISEANAIGGLYGGLYAPAANYYYRSAAAAGGGDQYRAQLNAASKGAVIPAAVQSRHSITFKEVKVPKSYVDTPVVEVQAQETPLYLQFKTYSSPIHASQTHYSAPKQALLKTLSADEPNYLYHVVNKPIYQEIREIIVPYRRVKQEIRPVVEHVNTVVASADGGGHQKSVPDSSYSSDDAGYNNNYPEYTYTGQVGYQFSGPVGVGYASAYKMRGSDAKPYSFDYSRVTTGGVAQHENTHTDANAQTYDSNQYSGNGADSGGYNNAVNSVEDLQYSGVTTNDGKEDLAHNNNVVHYYDQPVVVPENYDLNYITDDLLRLYKD